MGFMLVDRRLPCLGFWKLEGKPQTITAHFVCPNPYVWDRSGNLGQPPKLRPSPPGKRDPWSTWGQEDRSAPCFFTRIFRVGPPPRKKQTVVSQPEPPPNSDFSQLGSPNKIYVVSNWWDRPPWISVRQATFGTSAGGGGVLKHVSRAQAWRRLNTVGIAKNLGW